MAHRPRGVLVRALGSTTEGNPPVSRLVRSWFATVRRRPALVWWPVVLWAAWFVLNLAFVFVRRLGAHTFAPNDVEGIESVLFGGVPTRWLQANLYQRGVPWLDFAGFAFHGIWFGLPFAWGFLAMRYERAKLAEFLSWTTVVVYLGAIVFILAPVRPPWMEAGVTRVLVVSRGGYATLDDNPYAAFPSLHAGLAMTVALFFLLRCPGHRFWGWLAAAITAGISFSVVYMGEHWLIDVLAGWAVAGLTAYLHMSGRVRRLLARIPGDPVGRLVRFNARVYAAPAAEQLHHAPIPLPCAPAESEAA